MSRSGISPMIPLLFSNLNHSTPEWLENRINRATFAATGYASMILILSEHQDALDKDSLGNLIGQSIGMDTVYILRIGRTVGALYISDSEGLLIKYSPSTNEASFEKLIITNHGEIQTNEILESMILKGTIDAYYHVEYEEFLVMSDMINQSIQNGSVDEEEDQALAEKYYKLVSAASILIPSGYVNVPADKEERDKLEKKHYDNLVEAMKEAQDLIYKYGPFIQEEVFDGYQEILKLCQGHKFVYENRWNIYDLRSKEEKESFSMDDYKRTDKILELYDKVNKKLREYLQSLEIL